MITVRVAYPNVSYPKSPIIRTSKSKLWLLKVNFLYNISIKFTIKTFVFWVSERITNYIPIQPGTDTQKSRVFSLYAFICNLGHPGTSLVKCVFTFGWYFVMHVFPVCGGGELLQMHTHTLPQPPCSQTYTLKNNFHFKENLCWIKYIISVFSLSLSLSLSHSLSLSLFCWFWKKRKKKVWWSLCCMVCFFKGPWVS